MRRKYLSLVLNIQIDGSGFTRPMPQPRISLVHRTELHQISISEGIYSCLEVFEIYYISLRKKNQPRSPPKPLAEKQR